MTISCRNLPFGLLLLTALYGAFVTLVGLNAPTCILQFQVVDAEDCNQEGVANTVLDWSSDYFLAIALGLLAFSLCLLSSRPLPAGLSFACWSLGYGASAIARQAYGNSGTDDGGGLVEYYVLMIVTYLLWTVALLGLAFLLWISHRLALGERPEHDSRPKHCGFAAVRVAVFVSLVGMALVVTGSTWTLADTWAHVGTVDRVTDSVDASSGQNLVPPSIRIVEIGRHVWLAGSTCFFLSAAILWRVHASFRPSSMGGLSNRWAAAGAIIAQCSAGTYRLVLWCLASFSHISGVHAAFALILLQYTSLITLFFVHNLLCCFFPKQPFGEKAIAVSETKFSDDNKDYEAETDEDSDSVEALDEPSNYEKEMHFDFADGDDGGVEIDLEAGRRQQVDQVHQQPSPGGSVESVTEERQNASAGVAPIAAIVGVAVATTASIGSGSKLLPSSVPPRAPPASEGKDTAGCTSNSFSSMRDASNLTSLELEAADGMERRFAVQVNRPTLKKNSFDGEARIAKGLAVCDADSSSESELADLDSDVSNETEIVSNRSMDIARCRTPSGILRSESQRSENRVRWDERLPKQVRFIKKEPRRTRSTPVRPNKKKRKPSILAECYPDANENCDGLEVEDVVLSVAAEFVSRVVSLLSQPFCKHKSELATEADDEGSDESRNINTTLAILAEQSQPGSQLTEDPNAIETNADVLSRTVNATQASLADQPVACPSSEEPSTFVTNANVHMQPQFMGFTTSSTGALLKAFLADLCKPTDISDATRKAGVKPDSSQGINSPIATTSNRPDDLIALPNLNPANDLSRAPQTLTHHGREGKHDECSPPVDADFPDELIDEMIASLSREVAEDNAEDHAKRFRQVVKLYGGKCIGRKGQSSKNKKRKPSDDYPALIANLSRADTENGDGADDALDGAKSFRQVVERFGGSAIDNNDKNLSHESRKNMMNRSARNPGGPSTSPSTRGQQENNRGLFTTTLPPPKKLILPENAWIVKQTEDQYDRRNSTATTRPVFVRKDSCKSSDEELRSF
jgi:hypothetical protein